MTTSPRPTDDRVHELEAKVAQLTALVERLTSGAGTAGPEAASTTAADDTVPVAVTSSRRGMLKLAGAAAVGAVGVAVASSMPAAADNGITQTNELLQTNILYKGNASTGNGFLFQASNGGSGFPNSSSTYPAALAAWSVAGANQKHGFYGSSNSASGFGVVAENNANGVGLKATGGSAGATTTGTSFGLFATSSGAASYGVGAVGGGSGSSGVIGAGDYAGVSGTSSGYGVASLITTKANLFLQPDNTPSGGAATPKTAPPTRSDAHLAGEMECVGGDLWFCVKDGTPGTWRRISGLAGAGGFHAITPTRVYDSRGMTPGGPLAALSTRDLPIRDKVDPLNYAVLQANAIPKGATAVAANVSVVNTQGSGFLALNPYTDGTVHAATINWFGTGQILNNGVNVTLGGDRQITVIAGGGAGSSTDFIIDITGFYL
jgi:hypothetical protein